MKISMGRRCVKKISFILGAGLLGLSFGPIAGAFSLNDIFSSASPQAPAPKSSRINRALPGMKTGMLQSATGNTVQIDNTIYSLAPGIVIESQTGSPMPLSTGWQKFLRRPLGVQYWLGQSDITQMIVYLPS